MVNIESFIICWLGDLGYRAFADVPRNRPDEFCTVERTGGGLSDVAIVSNTVAIQCWAKSRLRASQMANRIAREIPQMRYSCIASSDVETFYNFPDLDGGVPRYQIVARFVTR